MKKFNSIVLVLLLLFVNVLMFCGCNRKIFDFNFTLNYAVIYQNGQRVLHKVELWSDSESESCCIHTTCCDNYIWFSANNGELYTNLPKECWFDVVCEDC